jgi:NapC/NirT cytochrome c family, N-terminal region
VTSRAALARHPLAIAGALIATVSAVVFIALAIAMVAGLLENPYAGLVVFVAIPFAFVLGLLLIPAGMRLQRRKLQRDPNAAADWPILDFRRADVRRGTLIVVALTAVNIVLLLLAGYGTLHWMESPTFCGQVCHAPMHPQFTAWQGASHGRVACVSCHIGEGAAAFVHAKLSGVRQLVHVMKGSYPRPIPPGAEMPPGAQARTCTSCHQPGRSDGDVIRVVREYADDEENSETKTILQMHLGKASSAGRAIHWHANPAVRVEYVSTDATNETIPYVRVTDAKGQVKEYAAADAPQGLDTTNRQAMDCVDCHNTVGHPIAAIAERAVDDAIAAGLVSRQLPFARREGVRLVKASYSSEETAIDAIDRGFREFYQSRSGSVDPHAMERSVAALQDVYRRNVFPTMKVTWGSYPDNKGHVTATGCFRCHDGSHTAKDGSTINADCEYCHKQIEAPQ